jgi:hypothetical protein
LNTAGAADGAGAADAEADGIGVREAAAWVSCPETAKPTGTRSAPTATTIAQVRILTRERSLTPAAKTIVDVD